MKKVFICYSQKDSRNKERLQTHLAFFAKQGQLEFWSDEQIRCGDEWDPEIVNAINESCAAILLISADFLASNYIQDRELPLIFQKRQNEGMKVFPFILFACNWQSHRSIPKINARPMSGKPLNSFHGKNEKEEALTTFTYEIQSIISSELSTEIEEPDIEIEKDNSTLPLIEKLHNLTNRFYPLAVLKQDTIPGFNPFNENLNPRHSQYINRYNLKLANDGIAESLKQWNDDLLHEPSSKILDIFSFLSSNLIVKISGIRVKEFRINSIKTQCSCPLCTFDNLDLKLLDEKINSNNTNYLENDSIQNRLQNAYINYRTLNLVEAYNQINQILNSVKKEEDKERKIIAEFICKSNLQNLYWFFRNTNYTENSQLILKELEEPNLYSFLFNENIDEQVRTQLEYISNAKFIKSVSYKIDKALIEIRKSVDVNRNVQYHIEELTYQLAYIYSFIRKNFLFYDLFDDFKVIAVKAIDGIFAAFSVQENIPKDSILGSYMKIPINDFILNISIFHCDTENLIRIFKRYDIKKLPINAEKLITKTINLCESPELFDKYNGGNEYRSLYKNFESVFENLLFLISTCENNPRIKDLFAIVVNLLDRSKSRFTLLGLRHFMAEKKKFINYDDLTKLLKIVLVNYKHEEKIIADICWILKEEFSSEKIKDSTFIDIVIESKNEDSLFFLWFIVNTETKEKIQQIIINSLQESFSFTQYIDCAIFGIISYETFLSNSYEYLKNAKYKGLYEKVGPDYITDDYNDFNYLIQLVYTFDIEIPMQFIEAFEQYSDYHKFLLNPEKFDYSKFDVEWLFVFQRKVYWERFRKIEDLKVAVKNKLSKDYSNELAEICYKHLK